MDWPVTVSILRDATLNGVLYGGGIGVSTLVTAQGVANSVLTANAGAPVFSSTPILTSLILKNVSQVLPLGLWRTILNNDDYRLEKNTAVAGDFSTGATFYTVNSSGHQIHLTPTTALGINAAPNLQYMVGITGIYGDFTATYHETFFIGPTMRLMSNGQGSAGVHIWPTLERQSTGGTYSNYSALKITAPAMSVGTDVCSVANTLWLQNPPTGGQNNYILRADGGGTVLFNVDTFEIGRNLSDNAGSVTTLLVVGKDVTTDYDKTRAGSLIGAYIAPSLRLESAATYHASVEIRTTSLTDGSARVLTNQIALQIDPGVKDANTTVTNAYGMYLYAPTIGGTKNITAHFDGTVELSAINATTALTVTSNIDNIGAVSGGLVTTGTRNTSNTASSRALFYAEVAGASADDPYSLYSIVGVQNWVFGIDNSDSDKFKIAPSAVLGTSDAFVITTTGNINLGSVGTSIGFLGATAVAQQTSGANLTNNVTSGGTTDIIADFTSLTVYASDAAAIRNDIYQLARKLKQINDGLRLYGLFT